MLGAFILMCILVAFTGSLGGAMRVIGWIIIIPVIILVMVIGSG